MVSTRQQVIGEHQQIMHRFQQIVEEIYVNAEKEGRLIYNPSNSDLIKFALEEPEIKKTKYKNIMAESEPTSRAAMFTKNNIDYEFGEEEFEFLEQAKSCLSKETLVSIDVKVGNGNSNTTARLIVPKKFAHLPYAGSKLFEPTTIKNPTYQILFFFDDNYEHNKTQKLPKKDIIIRNVHLPDGSLIKVIKNSSYIGEWKKGVFAGEDFRVKQNGEGIFLHAGCRQDYLETAQGEYKTKSSLFVALSANGKTALTCKDLAKNAEERSSIIQDDGGTLRKGGSFRGFEAGGLFVKTDGLNHDDQPETYNGTLKPDSFLENVYVDKNGEIVFDNIERTSNGRAIIERKDFEHTSEDIEVDKVNNLFIITRGNIIPAVSKLSTEQAVAFMVLGQSMESSAGDPTQAGKIRSVFFYDPFVAGDRSNHANLFYNILRLNPRISCYLLNTGGVGEGEKYHNIKLKDTANILDSVLRENIESWVESKVGLMVPKYIESVDSKLLHPEELYSKSEFESKKNDLFKQMNETLHKYQDLDEKVKNVFVKYQKILT